MATNVERTIRYLVRVVRPMRSVTSALFLLAPMLALAQPPVKDALDAADDKARAVIEGPVGRPVDPRVDTLHIFDRVDVMPEPNVNTTSLCTGKVLLDTTGLGPDCRGYTKVYLRFIVERDGRITAPAVVKATCPTLDQIAIGCLPHMGPWIPGSIDGAPVRVRMVWPVEFTAWKRN